MKDQRDLLLTCACCPAPCRSAIPAEGVSQAESGTPSALSMIALAVLDGQLPWNAESRAALGRLAAARRCVPHCPYGLDIPAAVERLASDLDAGRP